MIASDALQRIDIKAPVNGTVQQMRVFTVGGVIRPGDPILDIVPFAETLVVRAKVLPTDIDRILPGMKVEIRVPQFTRYDIDPIHRLRAQRFAGHSDRHNDATRRKAILRWRSRSIAATIPEAVRGRITAGMQVDAIILTQERTVLNYLTSPILNRVAKSMRER